MQTEVFEIVSENSLRLKSSLKRILSFLDGLNIPDKEKAMFRKIILDEVNGLFRVVNNGD